MWLAGLTDASNSVGNRYHSCSCPSTHDWRALSEQAEVLGVGVGVPPPTEVLPPPELPPPPHAESIAKHPAARPKPLPRIEKTSPVTMA